MNSDFNYVFKKLKGFLPKSKVKKNEPMANHTTFKIGGKAKVFAVLENLEQIVRAVELLNTKQIKYFVLGNGSNVLFADEGFDGVVLKISDNFNHMYHKNNVVVCESGASLNALCNYAGQNGLSGLEHAYGIPASVGGAVYMNARAFDYETGACVTSVLALINGKITLLNNAECNFAYKHSVFMEHKNAIVLQAEFTLKKGKKEDILNEYLQTMALRKQNQPLNYPSAGCIFKQREDINISKTIDDDGLKGYTVGGAQISTKHANFVVNLGNATASDVLKIIEYVKAHFKNKYNLEIECEVEYIS